MKSPNLDNMENKFRHLFFYKYLNNGVSDSKQAYSILKAFN